MKPPLPAPARPPAPKRKPTRKADSKPAPANPQRIHVAGAARELGVSAVTVQHHLTQPGAPKSDAAGKFDRKELLSFIRRRQRARSESVGKMADARRAAEAERAKMLRLKRKMTEGSLVPLAEHNRVTLEMARTIKNEGDQLQGRLPPLLAGKTLPEMAIIIDRAWRDVCRSLNTAPLLAPAQADMDAEDFDADDGDGCGDE